MTDQHSAPPGVGTLISMSCPYCGCYPAHPAMRCPQVRAIEYHPNGTVKRIEFNR